MRTKDLIITADLLYQRFGAVIPEQDQSAFMRLISLGDMTEWAEHEQNAFIRVARARGDVLGHAAKQS